MDDYKQIFLCRDSKILVIITSLILFLIRYLLMYQQDNIFVILHINREIIFINYNLLFPILLPFLHKKALDAHAGPIFPII